MPWFRFRLRRTRRLWMYVEQRSAMLAKRQASAILGRIAFDFERCEEPPRLKAHVARFALKYFTERLKTEGEQMKIEERGRYEVRYDDKKGRYTEENFHTRRAAFERVAKLRKAGIEAEVFEVQQ